jgi:hypothetical protein
VKTLLEFCWGLTLYLSNNDNEHKLANIVNDKIFENLDEDGIEFSRDLKIVFCKALRSIAFVRDAHLRFLNYNAKDLERNKQYWDQIGQLLSFSKDALPLQIISFLGFGSLGNATSFLSNSLNQSISSPTMPTLFLTNFILYGIVGIIVVTVGSRIVGYFYVGSQQKKIENKQKDYYHKNLKKETTESLFYLYQDIKRLFEQHNLKDDDMFKWPDKYIKEFIYNNILPPDNILWYPAQRTPEYQ